MPEARRAAANRQDDSTGLLFPLVFSLPPKSACQTTGYIQLANSNQVATPVIFAWPWKISAIYRLSHDLHPKKLGSPTMARAVCLNGQDHQGATDFWQGGGLWPLGSDVSSNEI